jgi:predicted phosphodiesterase
MEVVTKRISLEDIESPLYIVPLGDVHYGNINCDLKKFKDTIEYIKNKPNCYAVLMGDMCDSIMISDKRFDVSTIAKELRDDLDDLAMAQYTKMRDMLMPIKDKILASVDGNHGDTLHKKYHTDFDAYLAKELGVSDMGISGFLVIKFDRKQFHTETVTIYMHHGFVAGRQSGNKLNAMDKLRSSYEADIFLCGHSHDLFAKSYLQVAVAGENIKSKKQYVANTGTFLKTVIQGATCYAEAAGYPPQKTGVIKITLIPSNKNVDIHLSE